MIGFILICIYISGLDTKSEDCQRFFRDGLTTSFHKILNDEAVNGWKYEIHVSTPSMLCCQVGKEGKSVGKGVLIFSLPCHPQKAILKNTEKLVELCVTKLSQDWFPLLDLLALAFNPMSRYVHMQALCKNILKDTDHDIDHRPPNGHLH